MDKVKFFTFSKFHNKSHTGSTEIRVSNLLKFWPGASLYRYGDDYDVLILQKIYAGQDYKLPVLAKPIKILDICDPDWLDNAYIAETISGVQAVVTPTEPLAEFIRQFTDKPVRVIKDRFVVEDFPKPKVHKGEAKSVVWFGYSHNGDLLKPAIATLEILGYSLTIIANERVHADRWGSENFQYKFVEFDRETLHREIQQHDICLMPKGFRPQDRFKSENKTIISELLGVPVTCDKAGLEKFRDPAERNKEAQERYRIVSKEYDARNSVEEYKNLIEELK